MKDMFSLQIVTPSHSVFDGDIKKVFLKNSDGELEILANHENMIISTVPAVVTFIDSENVEKKLFVSASIVQVGNGEVVICTDAAEFPENIDFERAEKARKCAEDRIKNAQGYEKEMLKLSLTRALERLKLKR
jgi:F-type H+-transporting ATPase subunit epsilon